MVTIEQVMSAQRDFAVLRDWQKFHTPKNVAMAMGGEAGELCVAVRALLDAGIPPQADFLVSAVSEECADVALYLIRLYEILGVEFPSIEPRRHDDAHTIQYRKGDWEIVGALLGLCGAVGRILEVFQWLANDVENCTNPRADDSQIVGLLGAVVDGLFELSDLVNVDVVAAAAKKLKANELRYPVQSSRGSSQKYTELENL